MTNLDLNVIMRLIDRFSGPMQRVNASLRTTAETMGTTVRTMQESWAANGEAMRSIGKKMSMYVSLPIALGFGYAAKTAMSFEDALSGIYKTVEGTPEELETLGNQLRELSQRNPTRFEDLARVAENAGQLGVATNQIVAFTEVMAMMGTATNLNAEEASVALAKFANSTGMQQTEENWRRLGSVVVHVGNKTAAAETEIVDMATEMGGVASKYFNMTQREIVGLAGALASVKVPPELARGAVTKMGQDISRWVYKNSNELKAMSTVTGLTVDEFKRMHTEAPLELMQKFAQGVQKIYDQKGPGAMGQFLSGLGWDERRISTFITLMASSTKGADAMGKAVKASMEGWGGDSGWALEEEAKKKYADNIEQLRTFRNEFRLLLESFGAPLADLATRIAHALMPLIRFLRALPDPVKKVILIMLGIVAIVGPIVAVAGAFVGLYAILKVVGISMLAIGGWVTVAIVALIALGTMIMKLGGVIAWCKRLWNSFMAALSNAYDGSALQGLVNAIATIARWLQKIVNLVDYVIAAFTRLGQTVRSHSNISRHLGFGRAGEETEEEKKEQEKKPSFGEVLLGQLIPGGNLPEKQAENRYGKKYKQGPEITKEEQDKREAGEKKEKSWLGRLSDWKNDVLDRSDETGKKIEKNTTENTEKNVTENRTETNREQNIKETRDIESRERKYVDHSQRTAGERPARRTGPQRPAHQEQQTLPPMGPVPSAAEKYYKVPDVNSNHEVTLKLDKGLEAGDVKEKGSGNSRLRIINTPGYSGHLTGGN